MTPPQGSSPRPPRPRSASPAERSVELQEAQRRMKEEAAERRAQAAKNGDGKTARPSGSSRG